MFVCGMMSTRAPDEHARCALRELTEPTYQPTAAAARSCLLSCQHPCNTENQRFFCYYYYFISQRVIKDHPRTHRNFKELYFLSSGSSIFEDTIYSAFCITLHRITPPTQHAQPWHGNERKRGSHTDRRGRTFLLLSRRSTQDTPSTFPARRP